MGYQYGIGICRQTLVYLSSNENFEDRLFNGFSEIEVIRESDASPQHRKQITELRQKYLSVKKEGFTVNDKGSLAEPDKEAEFKELAHSLTWLCVEIIQHNARNSTKE